MRRSAGIIAYKKIEKDIYIFLAHPGGPYWEGKNIWSILKGEYKDEKAICAAKREFEEECNQEINWKEIKYIHTEKVSNRKIVIFFASEIEDIDSSSCKSNTFKKEFPTGSGIIEEYPEMDKYGWFKIDEAMSIVIPNQRKAISRLKNLS